MSSLCEQTMDTFCEKRHKQIEWEVRWKLLDFRRGRWKQSNIKMMQWYNYEANEVVTETIK